MTLLRVAEPQEERAHRLEREFQAVLDAAVDAVVLFDHEGRIELLNHAGERMFGYNEQEVISRFESKGLAGFLQKPFTVEQLAAKLRSILARP